VMHMMLQILEEGKLTDGLGRQVDFRNTVVILTSNLGAAAVTGGKTIGFGLDTEESDYQSLKTRMLDDAKKVFKPEFLNRVDDLVVFRSLTREDVSKILDLEVEKVRQRLLKRGGIGLDLAAKARGFLIDKGFDADYGARPMRRAVEKFLEDPLAEDLLRGKFDNTSSIRVQVGDDCLVFKHSKTAVKEEAGTS